MCLGVPGRIEQITETDPVFRSGKVSFGGIRKDISLAYVPNAKVGDYVIVHVGFAISQVDEEEAEQVFEYLKKFDELADLEETNAEFN